MEARIEKAVDAPNVYFTVYWSRLEKSDRYKIVTAVPAMSGIFELYYQDDHKQLNLFHIAKAWYGGLRSWIRKATDPELEQDKERKAILENHDCFFRYTIIPSYADMCDVLFFFADTYRPRAHKVQPSGRYEHIYLNEVSQDKIVNVQ